MKQIIKAFFSTVVTMSQYHFKLILQYRPLLVPTMLCKRNISLHVLISLTIAYFELKIPKTKLILVKSL